MVDAGEGLVKVHGGSRGRCPYCHDACAPDDDNVVCNECLARHHRHCWGEGGERCSNCRSTTAAGGGGGGPREPRPAPRPTAAPKPLEGASLEALPPFVRERLEAELEKGEQVLWAGQPAGWRTLPVLQSLAMALFAVPWTGFAVFWIVMASSATGGGGPAAFMPLFGVPFVLVGLAMLSSPLWALRGAARTGYAVTDRRVIVCETSAWGTTAARSFGPEVLPAMTRNDHPDGRGDLVLHTEPGRRGMDQQRGLMSIARVREVEALVRQVLGKP